MNNIIRINQAEIGGTSVQTVNARSLHEFLESKQEFANWIKGRIDQYAFVQGQDFTVDKIINGRATQIDYHLTIDTAKELSMVERNAKGKEARQYFIECERRAKAPVDPMQALSDPAMMRGLLLTYTEKVLKLEESVKALEPKAEAFDRVATFADGAMCLTDSAKVLQQQPKKFFAWLQEIQWIFKRAGSKTYKGYQNRIQSGFLQVKTTTVEKSDGGERICEQVLITAKGLMKLSEALNLRNEEVTA